MPTTATKRLPSARAGGPHGSSEPHAGRVYLGRYTRNHFPLDSLAAAPRSSGGNLQIAPSVRHARARLSPVGYEGNKKSLPARDSMIWTPPEGPKIGG